MDFFKPYFAYTIGLLFFVYAAASLVWYFDSEAVYLLVKWFILLQAFVLGHYLKDLKQVFEGLALGIGVSSILVLLGMKGGLFINTNTLSETSAIVLVGLCIYKLWYYIPLLIPCFFMPSRASIVALGLTFIFWIFNEYNSRSAKYLAIHIRKYYLVWSRFKLFR